MGSGGYEDAAAPTATGLGCYGGASAPTCTGWLYGDEGGSSTRAMGLDARLAMNMAENCANSTMNDHYSRRSSGMDTSISTPIDSSNIGFRLLKKHGWKEGTGLGIAEQGRLEPVEALIKKNKLGLGAEKGKNSKKASEHATSETDGKKEKLKKKTKAATKKMKKMLEMEKRLQETELVRDFYREFWPDNV